MGRSLLQQIKKRCIWSLIQLSDSLQHQLFETHQLTKKQLPSYQCIQHFNSIQLILLNYYHHHTLKDQTNPVNNNNDITLQTLLTRLHIISIESYWMLCSYSLLPDLWPVCRDATTSLRSRNNSTSYLPVRQRILFKITVLVFQGPSYLSDDCQPVSDSRPRHLRSSDSLTFVVRRAHNTYGDRWFATAGPQVWNFLPAELQSCDSLRPVSYTHLTLPTKRIV